MLSDGTIKGLFASIDAMDAIKFASFLTEDGTFVYGTMMSVTGRSAVEEAVAGFFGTLSSLSHRDVRSWDGGDGETVFVGGEVTYVLPNEKMVEIPFMNKFIVRDGKISLYQVYTDPTTMIQAMQG
ncbi:MAG TPA: nuclear transport factor 2 family protein [Bacteroidetes bacterium]|nr:nuclear transport factor 2 family protein [Bacteroidota bacterium]HEX05587.1 nuclear transport factor 2 family protein [Bacteroidota bacterium]